MNHRNHLLLAGLLLAAVPAAATPITLTFDEIPNYKRPGQFYDGGVYTDAGNGAPGPTSGPDLGVTMIAAGIVFQGFDVCPEGGCNGIFPIQPGLGYRALYNFPSLTSDPAVSIINVADGFTGEASVWHFGGVSALTVFEGLNGRYGGGSPPTLGSVAMPLTTGCIVDSGTLAVSGCGWTKYTVSFAGTARSIELAGFAAYYDNVSLGAPETTTGAVPEPASWALLIAGFGLTGAAMRRRRVNLAALSADLVRTR